MGRFLFEYEPQTVDELRKVLVNLPSEMPVTDAIGDLLCIRIYEDETGDRTLEFQ